MSDQKDLRRHFILGAGGKAEPFTAPSSGGRADHEVPARDRQAQAARLSRQLGAVANRQQALVEEAQAYELESRLGIQVAFESFPGVELAVESLADARQHIELMNVRRIGDQIVATAFVPDGKLTVFESKLQAYQERRTDRIGRARDHQKLIDAIQSFRATTLQALWSDSDEQWPADAEESIWWEAWLPVREDRQAVIHDFTLVAEGADIEVSPFRLEFPERSVLLAKGCRNQLASSGLLLNTISELRRAKEAASFFDGLPPPEQAEWSADLLSRLTQAEGPSPHVCILDTGVNNGHPLLAPFVDPMDLYAGDPNWDPADTQGHGTGMAGLATWGDLVEPLASALPVRIAHRLESVKLLRYAGDNEGKHLGVVTADGVSLPEISQPDRTRLFAMALSTTDGRDQGRPSAWSGELDSLACDYLGENENPRLFVICAGNTGDDLTLLQDYPQHNELQDVHDPGQAWNAVTVGAYTEKVELTEQEPEYEPLAPAGGLSPYSTTSVTWANGMPIKPEVVFEGGNVGRDRYGCAGLPNLKLLTTHQNPVERQFSTFEATSAATALASRFAAQIYTQYPALWPETVRALMVHSAHWTEAMRQQFRHGNTRRQQAQHRVRCVGYGVPDLERALWSAGNSLSLIVEDRLQPFQKLTGKSPQSRDMHLHSLPWPKENLEVLGETEVEMTVTLSYFIEPNPSSRNISGRYRYPSHQLRFDVKRATESVDEFRHRINRQARDEETGSQGGAGDPNWLFGPQFRNKGSIHKDVWTGKAVDLAVRGQIAVFPAMGWWRTRTKLERYDKTTRYSLVVSIAAPEVEIDLYSEIAAQIEIESEIAT